MRVWICMGEGDEGEIGSGGGRRKHKAGMGGCGGGLILVLRDTG